MCGRIEVEASDIDKAKQIAVQGAPLPKDGEYVEDSFQLDDPIIEEEQFFVEKGKK
jgi:hypothetical protein